MEHMETNWLFKTCSKPHVVGWIKKTSTHALSRPCNFRNAHDPPVGKSWPAACSLRPRSVRDPLTHRVIGCAIDVHRRLGPGLLESVYEGCVADELTRRNIPFRRQVALPVTYRDKHIDFGYRVDLLIEERLIIEVKAVTHVMPVHHAQLLTYMKLLKVKQGVLINSNVAVLVRGIKSFLL